MLKRKPVRPPAAPIKPAKTTTQELNILLTCIGRRVSLLGAFRRAMAGLGLTGRLCGSDWSPMAPAFYEADQGFLVPGVNAPHYVDALLEICKRHKIGLLIPLVDTELLVLAQSKQRFAEIGTRVVVSSPRVVQICRDKEKTANFLLESGIGAARPMSLAQARQGPFPLIAKARSGSSTKNVREVHHPGALGRLQDSKIDYVFQEYVEGKEFTVDVYAGFDGVPRVAVPRERLQVRAGEVVRGLTVRDPRLIDEGLKLVRALAECIGVITAQCRLTPEGQVKFFDVNPRFGGGVPLAIRAGADFPRWILQEQLGQKPEIDPEAWEEGLLMMRYDAEVFRRMDQLAKPE
jgi:carbamoyl-phosphate synthase large subunit